MERDYGYTAAVDGLVLSAFFAGYLCTQVLGGWAASDRTSISLVPYTFSME
jgi:hypothetical protein